MRDVLNQITPESLFMVALLADAVTEGLQFLRRVDKEATHAETLFADVHDYRLRLITLFGDRGCAYDAQRSVGTFAHVVRGALQRERALVFRGALGGAHVIGGQGLSTEVLQRCAGRMRDWVCMCLAALETEFPEWEIAQAFRVFDVSPNACLSAAMVAESIGRLAKRFAVDPTALKAQLEAVLPLARRRYHALGTSKAAMVAAIEDFAERVKVADRLLRAGGCTKRAAPTAWSRPGPHPPRDGGASRMQGKAMVRSPIDRGGARANGWEAAWPPHRHARDSCSTAQAAACGPLSLPVDRKGQVEVGKGCRPGTFCWERACGHMCSQAGGASDRRRCAAGASV